MPSPEKNALIDFLNSDLDFVPYSQIKPEMIVEAVSEAIKQAQDKLESILKILDTKTEPDFENTMKALIEVGEIVDKVWSPVDNLLNLEGKKEIREAAEQARPLVVEFFNDYSLDKRVYKLIKKYSLTNEALNLEGEYKRYLDESLRDLKLSGAELEDDKKEEFKKLNLELAELSQKFSDNVTDSKFDLLIKDKADLSGLPEDAISMAQREDGTWVFNLDYPSYSAFMRFSDKGQLRKELYFKYLSRASREFPTEELDNDKLIPKIRTAKLKKANLLGYKNYAELSLETKMAPNPEYVIGFLERLALKARPLAEKEYAELLKFQKKINYENTEKNPEKVYPWDKEYLAEKLKKEKFDFDTNLLKPYFEIENTISGMFALFEKLLGIKFELNKSIDVWNEDVKPYEVLDSESGIKLGTIFLDLYPRETKRDGAWVSPLVQGAEILKNGSLEYRKPQCTLSCNFAKPTAQTPSLLNHREVETLFHELGHALHHTLTKAKLSPMSGTSVEWDFVELPSQLNENFTWEKPVLKSFAKHYITGEIIPDELIERMRKSRIFNEGLACLRQLCFALFDFQIYMNSPDDKRAVDIFRDCANKYDLWESTSGTNFPCSFSHIFAGGYAAGYYSYKWAELLEADAFGEFKKTGIINPETGMKYRKTILEKGDSEEPMKLFIDFVGREPREDALLERMGLA